MSKLINQTKFIFNLLSLIFIFLLKNLFKKINKVVVNAITIITLEIRSVLKYTAAKRLDSRFQL